MKKLTALILVSLLLVSVLCGCNGDAHTPAETLPAETTVPVTEVQADYEEVYAEILDETYDFLIADKAEVQPSSGQLGIAEAVAQLDSDKALGVVGYMFKDLTGDGFAELIIADVAESEDSWFKTSEIFAIYTVAFDMPLLLAEGTARSSYKLLDDGTFLYEGSGGAAYTGVGNFRMSNGGMSLVCNEFYFTEPDEADPNTAYVYKNTSGKWDTELSEKTDLSLDDIKDIRAGYEGKLVSLDLTAFSEYNK